MSWKKLLMALPILAFGVATDVHAATYDCWRTDISASLFKDRDTSESYLYAEESHKGNGGDYLGFVCGHEGTKGCPAGAVVLMPKGHVLANQKKNSASAYMCNTSGYNKWMERDMESVIDDCKAGEVKKFKLFQNEKIGKYYYMCETYSYNACYHGRKCKATEAQYQCEKDSNSVEYDFSRSICKCKSGYDWKNNKCEKDINNLEDQRKCAQIGGHWYNGICKCLDTEYYDKDEKQCMLKSKCNKSAQVCADNVIVMTDFANNNVSVRGGNANANATNTNTNENHNNSDNTTVSGGDNGGNTGSNCRASRSTPEGRACCSLPNSVAKYNSSTKGCDCVDSSKVFKIYSGEVGRCVSKSGSGGGNGGGNGSVASTPCDCAAAVKVATEAKTSCAASSQVVLTAIMTINAKCPAGQPGASCDADELSAYVEGITSMIAECSVAPVQPVEPVKPTVDSARLTNAIANLDKYRSALDVSVWKDEEGNFNTSRLVSDSIAGVVLGTAGGLITSSVVKKNQIKSGFEDIVCTVGGQEVGSYGDEITVGIQ